MAKVLVVLLGGLLLTVVTALFTAVFFYAAWNWGVVPALSFAKEVNLFQAFFLALGVSAIGASFKTSLTVRD